jgi:hypothetical protein
MSSAIIPAITNDLNYLQTVSFDLSTAIDASNKILQVLQQCQNLLARIQMAMSCVQLQPDQVQKINTLNAEKNANIQKILSLEAEEVPYQMRLAQIKEEASNSGIGGVFERMIGDNSGSELRVSFENNEAQLQNLENQVTSLQNNEDQVNKSLADLNNLISSTKQQLLTEMNTGKFPQYGYTVPGSTDILQIDYRFVTFSFKGTSQPYTNIYVPNYKFGIQSASTLAQIWIGYIYSLMGTDKPEQMIINAGLAQESITLVFSFMCQAGGIGMLNVVPDNTKQNNAILNVVPYTNGISFLSALTNCQNQLNSMVKSIPSHVQMSASKQEVIQYLEALEEDVEVIYTEVENNEILKLSVYIVLFYILYLFVKFTVYEVSFKGKYCQRDLELESLRT